MKENIYEIECIFSDNNVPLKYRLEEYKLILNKQLYDEKAIDYNTFLSMSNKIISKLKWMKTKYKIVDKEIDL